MIPQAYDERVTFEVRRPRFVALAWRLCWLRAVLAALRRWRFSGRAGVPMGNMREGSGTEPVAAFSMSHPAVPALYIVLTLGLTMFSMQPVLIVLSLAGGLAYGFATRGAARTLGALRWQLPVILIIAGKPAVQRLGFDGAAPHRYACGVFGKHGVWPVHGRAICGERAVV